MATGRLLNHVVLLTAIMIAIAGSAFAFCPMCRAHIANAEDSTVLSQNINSAVLVLLVPTLLIMCGLIRLVFKYGRNHDEDEQEEMTEN
jgi:hypothetical protein